MKTNSRVWLLSALSIISLSGCPPDNKPVVATWNQTHGDPANSSQLVLVGTRPARDGTAKTAQVRPIGSTSPVLAPDGSVYVSTFTDTEEPRGELIRLSTGSAVSVTKRFPLGGQLTTPAVDGAGNVYVGQYTGTGNESHLLIFGPQNEAKGNISLGKNDLALSSPKVLNVSGGSLVFQTYFSRAPFGTHLLIANDRGQVLGDSVFCKNLVNSGFCCNFQVPPLDPGNRVLEEPAIAIGVVGGERYLALASHACGVNFFRLGLGASNTDLPTLTPINFQPNDSVVFSTPAISTSGILVIASSNKRVTGYDVTTGEEKWVFPTSDDVIATPTVMPFSIAYVASYDHLTKLDVNTGNVEGQVAVIGRINASPVSGGSYVFVSTEYGLFTYNLDLKLFAFAPLAGGNSSPALGPTGEVFVVGRDGTFYVFPGP